MLSQHACTLADASCNSAEHIVRKLRVEQYDVPKLYSALLELALSSPFSLSRHGEVSQYRGYCYLHVIKLFFERAVIEIDLFVNSSGIPEG